MRGSYWLETGPIKSFPALNRDLSADVLVVGGGITGITTAHLLKKSGITVALIERNRLATADTGHTTAHLTYITDSQLNTLVKNLDAIMPRPPGMRARQRSIKSKR